jgi:stage III sporulation protein AF
MDFITDYVRKIAEFMLINAVVSVIVPNSKYKIYVNMIMGIILVALILSPVREIYP